MRIMSLAGLAAVSVLACTPPSTARPGKESNVITKEEIFEAHTTNLYDAVGNLTGSRDADNNLTKFGYDAANQRVTATDALNATTTFVNDKVGIIAGFGITPAALAANRHFRVLPRVATERFVVDLLT